MHRSSPRAHRHDAQLCVPADKFALRANLRLNTALYVLKGHGDAKHDRQGTIGN